MIEDVIIDNDRDRRALAWLRGHVGDESIVRAIGELKGARRPFVSNICKVLNVTIPAEEILTPKKEAKAHIEGLKNLLRKK